MIQGYRMLGRERENRAFRAPCPKVCIARWLVDVGRDLGVPDQQLVYIPQGLRHDKYRLQRPIAGRNARVSFCFSSHIQKGGRLAIDVLRRVRERVPDLEATAFGTEPPSDQWPQWMQYTTNPSQQALVDDIYNNTSVFLCTSHIEGFGLSCVEAMACGAALVTTDNGGSRDYAMHEETALVAPIGDVDALADHVVALLRDDGERVRLATAGREYIERFDWERSGELLESFLEEYLADPARYGRPE
jgi:glycosyltransferase involved in cell wall biosynthesis